MSPPRDRTLRKLRELLLKGALPGAALGMAAPEACVPIVCDPLPPPLECTVDAGSLSIANHVTVTATWRQQMQGLAAEVKLRSAVESYEDPPKYLHFTGDPTFVGATRVDDVTRSDTEMTFFFQPDMDVDEVKVEVPTDCNGETTINFVVTFDVSAAPLAGGSIPFDQYGS